MLLLQSSNSSFFCIPKHLAFCIKLVVVFIALLGLETLNSNPNQTNFSQFSGRSQLTFQQRQSLDQSDLSLDFAYTFEIESTKFTGRIYQKNKVQYIFPDQDFYAPDSVHKADISTELEGIGEKSVALARRTVVFGKLNKYLRGVHVKFSAINCTYPLVFFHATGNVDFEYVQQYGAHMARVLGEGAEENPFRILWEDFDFELDKWRFVENSHKDNRFLYFACLFYTEQEPQFVLVVDIDVQSVQYPQINPTDKPQDQAEQAQEVVQHFEEEENKDDKIVIEDVKVNQQGESIQAEMPPKEDQQEERQVIVNEVTAPMGTPCLHIAGASSERRPEILIQSQIRRALLKSKTLTNLSKSFWM